MSPAEDIQHFLLLFDVAEESVDIERFGTDYEAALQAYDEREKQYRAEGKAEEVDIVLLGADSLETIKRTHSSYFDGNREHGFAAFFKDALGTPG